MVPIEIPNCDLNNKNTMSTISRVKLIAVGNIYHADIHVDLLVIVFELNTSIVH